MDSAVRSARTLVRIAGQAALATLDRGTGHPHASLVATATEPDGTPLLLISKLAVHTQNLFHDQRGSLLFSDPGSGGDPLASGRVTLTGTVGPTSSTTARRRFLARHPASAAYAEFADFGFYSMTIERVHYVGGFGRMLELNPLSLLDNLADAADLVRGEEDLLRDINDSHRADLGKFAARLGAGAVACVIIDIDPSGFDIRAGERVLRIDFPSRVHAPVAAKTAILGMVNAELPGSSPAS